MGSCLEGFDFSHAGVKWVVGLFVGFVSVIARAPHCFLYLNQPIHDYKKKRKKQKEKKAPYFLSTFEHAILRCPAKEPARTRHLQGVLAIGPDAPMWSSAAPLARFIRSTATAFPPGMFSRPSSSASSISSRSPNVVSFGYFMSSQES